MSAESQILFDRLERVERQNRRLKWAGILVLLVLGALFLAGLAPEDRMMVAEAFTLLDEQGKPRAMLAMIDGQPTLALLDSGGKVRTGLSVSEDLPWIMLYNEEGQTIWKAP